MAKPNELQRKLTRLHDAVSELERELEETRRVLHATCIETCREWIPEKSNYCHEPAEFLIWGRLFDPEALGPRCYDHAADHVSHHALARSSHYALVDLRPARKILKP